VYLSGKWENPLCIYQLRLKLLHFFSLQVTLQCADFLHPS
jgi:hypothetical protein